MGLAPVPRFPERGLPSYSEITRPQDRSVLKGPLRFEEGVATDTDVPNDFRRGAYVDTAAASGTRSWASPEGIFKHADETMRERAHLGSAAWIDAQSMLSEFVQGSQAGAGLPHYEQETNPQTRVFRGNPTIVRD